MNFEKNFGFCENEPKTFDFILGLFSQNLKH